MLTVNALEHKNQKNISIVYIYSISVVIIWRQIKYFCFKKDANNNLICDLSAPGSSMEVNEKVIQSDLDPDFNEGLIQFIDERMQLRFVNFKFAL